MNDETVSIDAYSKNLIDNRSFRSKEYRKFLDNCYSIQHVNGIISSDILKCFIKKAFWNKKLREMLHGILWYVNKDSITDEVFQMLLKFPHRDRDTYLDIIAHSELAFYQFQIIYKETSCWEAFAVLFYKICEYDFFKEEDMLQLLRDNKDITYHGIKDCIEWALQNGYSNSSNPKLILAQTWLSSMDTDADTILHENRHL